MAHRIEIAWKHAKRDTLGSRVAANIVRDLALEIRKVKVVDVYTIDADLAPGDLSKLADCLTDPVIQEWAVDQSLARGFDWLVEVGLRPGVTDNVGRTATETARLVLQERFPEEAAVYTSRQYLINGELVCSEVERIANELLGNPLINRFSFMDRPTFEDSETKAPEVPRVRETGEPTAKTISLEIGNKALKSLSRNMTLALSLQELHAIQAFYRREDVQTKRRDRGLPTDPTDVELEAMAQTWSEHCKHKIFNAAITYEALGMAPEKIDSLFKTYISGATEKIRKMRGEDDLCLSVFVDNAGVWKLDDDWSLVFKVETHNSPSALDPYGGALTGIRQLVDVQRLVTHLGQFISDGRTDDTGTDDNGIIFFRHDKKPPLWISDCGFIKKSEFKLLH